ncbi:uncharacterized protein topaz1 isoform X1 [Erpetoichthys calabaricus]|uniref:uncharacterized protein topaz1 isoform X1 n=1 Tax=Erpetoichthys calabaricus TaxID=27687 RepID=UPI002234868F|nr:uncharacterized protein topaz1 isoform X1 [Erpetoichthys calabaricus]
MLPLPTGRVKLNRSPLINTADRQPRKRNFKLTQEEQSTAGPAIPPAAVEKEKLEVQRLGRCTCPPDQSGVDSNNNCADGQTASSSKQSHSNEQRRDDPGGDTLITSTEERPVDTNSVAEPGPGLGDEGCTGTDSFTRHPVIDGILTRSQAKLIEGTGGPREMDTPKPRPGIISVQPVVPKRGRGRPRKSEQMSRLQPAPGSLANALQVQIKVPREEQSFDWVEGILPRRTLRRSQRLPVPRQRTQVDLGVVRLQALTALMGQNLKANLVDSVKKSGKVSRVTPKSRKEKATCGKQVSNGGQISGRKRLRSCQCSPDRFQNTPGHVAKRRRSSEGISQASAGTRSIFQRTHSWKDENQVDIHSCKASSDKRIVRRTCCATCNGAEYLNPNTLVNTVKTPSADFVLKTKMKTKQIKHETRASQTNYNKDIKINRKYPIVKLCDITKIAPNNVGDSRFICSLFGKAGVKPEVDKITKIQSLDDKISEYDLENKYGLVQAKVNLCRNLKESCGVAGNSSFNENDSRGQLTSSESSMEVNVWKECVGQMLPNSSIQSNKKKLQLSIISEVPEISVCQTKKGKESISAGTVCVPEMYNTAETSRLGPIQEKGQCTSSDYKEHVLPEEISKGDRSSVCQPKPSPKHSKKNNDEDYEKNFPTVASIEDKLVTHCSIISKEYALEENVDFYSDDDDDDDSQSFSCHRCSPYTPYLHVSCARTYLPWPHYCLGNAKQVNCKEAAYSIKSDASDHVEASGVQFIVNPSAEPNHKICTSLENHESSACENVVLGVGLSPCFQFQSHPVSTGLSLSTTCSCSESAKDTNTQSEEKRLSDSSASCEEESCINCSRESMEGPSVLDVLPGNISKVIGKASIFDSNEDISGTTTLTCEKVECRNATLTTLSMDTAKNDLATTSKELTVEMNRPEDENAYSTASEISMNCSDNSKTQHLSICKAFTSFGDDFTVQDDSSDSLCSSVLSGTEDIEDLCISSELVMCEIKDPILPSSDISAGSTQSALPTDSELAENSIDIFRAYEEDAIVLDVIQDDPELFGSPKKVAGMAKVPDKKLQIHKLNECFKKNDIRTCQNQTAGNGELSSVWISAPETSKFDRRQQRINQNSSSMDLSNTLSGFQINVTDFKFCMAPNFSSQINTCNPIAKESIEHAYKSRYCRFYFFNNSGCERVDCRFSHFLLEDDEKVCMNVVDRFLKNQITVQRAVDIFIGHYERFTPGCDFDNQVFSNLLSKLINCNEINKVFAVTKTVLPKILPPIHLLLNVFERVKNWEYGDAVENLTAITKQSVEAGLILTEENFNFMLHKFDELKAPIKYIKILHSLKSRILKKEPNLNHQFDIHSACAKIKLCEMQEKWAMMGNTFIQCCQGTYSLTDLYQFCACIASSLMKNFHQTPAVPFCDFTEKVSQTNLNGLGKTLIGRIGISILFNYYRVQQWAKGCRVLEVLQRMQIDFSKLKCFACPDSTASRCHVLNISSEVFLNNGNLEQAIAVLKESDWIITSALWPCSRIDVLRRHNLLCRISKECSYKKMHKHALEVLKNLPGFKEFSGKIGASNNSDIFNAHLLDCIKNKEMSVSCNTVQFMMSKEICVDFSHLRHLIDDLGRRQLWSRARLFYKYGVSMGYYPPLDQRLYCNLLFIPCSLSEIEMVMSFEIYIVSNTNKIQKQSICSETLQIVLKRNGEPIAPSDYDYHMGINRLMLATRLTNPNLVLMFTTINDSNEHVFTLDLSSSLSWLNENENWAGKVWFFS